MTIERDPRTGRNLQLGCNWNATELQKKKAFATGNSQPTVEGNWEIQGMTDVAAAVCTRHLFKGKSTLNSLTLKVF